jgi:probable rRNA maturation factor
MTNDQTEIAVTIEDETWLDDLPNAEILCRQAALAALHGAGPRFSGTAEVSVMLTDDAAIQDLNARYRGKHSPTNVLSFPSDDLPAADRDMPLLLGDVVVAHGVVAREAAAAGKSMDSHLCHLIVHGVLHLLGHDHEVEAEAETMERLETAILADMGIADPYQPLPPTRPER